MEPEFKSRTLPRAIRDPINYNASGTQICISLNISLFLNSCIDTNKYFPIPPA